MTKGSVGFFVFWVETRGQRAYKRQEWEHKNREGEKHITS